MSSAGCHLKWTVAVVDRLAVQIRKADLDEDRNIRCQTLQVPISRTKWQQLADHAMHILGACLAIRCEDHLVLSLPDEAFAAILIPL